MIRMEVACFLVIAFMAIMYFSSRRDKTRIHKTFAAVMIITMLHLVFDGLTIYTVNNLETVPGWFNEVSHRLFYGTMIVFFYLIYRYIILLVEDEVKYSLNISSFSTVMLFFILVCTIVLPIKYIQTDQGNYSFGPAVYTLYFGNAIYIVLTIVTLIRYWKQIHPKKRNGISVALAILILVSLYQAVHPLALISGMGIMLIILSFYLSMENPDILLVEQIREEKRKADEANAAKSVFLSHMSHEIRTPMNAIVGMTEILLRTELTGEQREYLNYIRSSGNALVLIINDILDISKIEAGKMELVEDEYEIRPMLSDISMIIKNRIGDKPVELLQEIDENLPERLWGDGLRIRQIIINLLNNAVKFTDEGHVKLTIRVEKKEEEEASLFFSVSDTGQGIKQEDLGRLFEAFEQVDARKNKGKEGTGLGLSISSQLVAMMGGKLEVRSEYGVGSEFFFTISQKIVLKDAAIQEENESKELDFIAPDARILVVDDNAMNLKVAAGLLAPMRMQMEFAGSGKEALSMIAKKRYHLIFMDHMMPVMDGVETTKCIRQMEDEYCQNVPIVALTANAMKEAKLLFDEAGMNGFLTKPIDMRQMCRILRRWLPNELILSTDCADSAEGKPAEENSQQCEIVIEGIHTEQGIQYSGSKELFMSLLGDFYRLIDSKALKIEQYAADNMILDYTTEVHALKSTARMLGATELSEQFEHLEELGNAGDYEKIEKETPDVLSYFRSFKERLKPYAQSDKTTQHDASVEEVIMYLEGIREAIDGFDLDAADEAMKKLEECRLPQECQPLMENLKIMVTDVAMEDIMRITGEMIRTLSNRQENQ